jgi:hypothetical protein
LWGRGWYDFCAWDNRDRWGVGVDSVFDCLEATDSRTEVVGGYSDDAEVATAAARLIGASIATHLQMENECMDRHSIISFMLLWLMLKM